MRVSAAFQRFGQSLIWAVIVWTLMQLPVVQQSWLGEPEESEPFVVHIRNAKRGEVAVFRGEEEIVYVDRALVSRLQRAMRRAAW